MVSRFACYVREIVIINLEENFQVNKQTLTLTAPHFSENYIKMKINLNFYFRLFCGALTGFMKTFKTFIKPMEAPQRSVKIMLKLYFSLRPRSGWEGLTYSIIDQSNGNEVGNLVERQSGRYR